MSTDCAGRPHLPGLDAADHGTARRRRTQPHHEPDTPPAITVERVDGRRFRYEHIFGFESTPLGELQLKDIDGATVAKVNSGRWVDVLDANRTSRREVTNDAADDV